MTSLEMVVIDENALSVKTQVIKGQGVIRLEVANMVNGDTVLISGIGYQDICELLFALRTSLKSKYMREQAEKVRAAEPMYHHGEPVT